MSSHSIAGLGLVALLAAGTPATAQDVPFLESPDYVVDAMLELAGVTEQDVVYDLGSGDGRIVIAAAERFGASAVGIESDPELVRISERNALEAGVADRVRFVQGDFFEADFSEATVVAIYLLPKVNKKMRPVFERQLAPGARIVSHKFAVPGWDARRQIKTGGRNLYLYVMR